MKGVKGRKKRGKKNKERNRLGRGRKKTYFSSFLNVIKESSWSSSRVEVFAWVDNSVLEKMVIVQKNNAVNVYKLTHLVCSVCCSGTPNSRAVCGGWGAHSKGSDSPKLQ